MKREAPELDTLVEAARRFAAVQDSFAPEAALAAVMGPRVAQEPIVAARVLSALRQDCTVETGKTERWLMRPAARRKILAGEVAVADADTPVAKALAGRGNLAPEALDRMIGGDASPEELEAVAVALDRAGPSAPGFDRLDRLRSLLNTRRAESRTDARLAGGFFGREAELARLADWIAAPQAGPPMRTVHVSGLPGIGKSFLLERVIQMARLNIGPILVSLDFDRAGLNVLEAHGFFEEISRQVGDAVPEASAQLRAMRLKSAERRAAETGTSARYSVPRDLLEAMAGAVRGSGRRVLVVLDTLEVLRSRGETQVMTLFDRMDSLAEYGVAPLAIISAGRGDALDPVPARVEDRIRLEGIEDSAARLLLAARGVPERLWPRILPLARGNPLLLTLAAKAFEDADYDAGEIPAGAGEETIGGYLYRAILSRVPECLRRIANEGLILRAIDAEALTGVVAPALGITLTAEEARAALAELATHHWLVESDGAGNVRHRQDVRRAFLPLLYDGTTETRAAAEAINLRAAEWYGARDPVAALYHRLQATRFGHPMPEVPADLAREITGPILDELPAPAQDAVLQAQGRRSGFARAGAPEAVPQDLGLTDLPAPAPARETAHAQTDGDMAGDAPEDAPRKAMRVRPDERAVRDLELMLEKGDLREAGHVFHAGFGGKLEPDSPGAMVALCYLWLAGRWAAAVDLFRRQPRSALDRALEESPHLRGRVVLEIQAETGFGRLLAMLADDRVFDLALRSHDASQRTGMVGGALDFAFLVIRHSDAALPRRLDLARGLLASASGATEGIADTGHALAAARALREDFGLFHEPLAGGGPDDRRPAVQAEILQALNPYGAPLHALVSGAPEGRIAAFLEGLHPRLPEAAALFLPDLRGGGGLPDRLRGGPPDVVAALTAMGLCADWSSAHVIGRSLADLRLIARSAERWRRTVAGMWSYGARRPEGWTEQASEDRMSAARLDRLIVAPDPVAAARRQLAFWQGASDRGAGRFAGWVTAARAAGDARIGRPGEALAALLGAGAPGVVAVPLAVLAAHGVFPQAAGGRPDGDVAR